MRIKTRHPPREFCSVERKGGLATITLVTMAGMEEFEYLLDVYTLHEVPWSDDIDENVRRNFRAWLAAGAAAEREIERFRAAIREAMAKIGLEGN